MKSNLKILTQLSKNLKSKVKESPLIRIPKHMRKYPNMKYSKTDIIHYEKRIKNNFDFNSLNPGQNKLPIYKYRIDAHIQEVRYDMRYILFFYRILLIIYTRNTVI
jgi:hypothetical protein